MHAGPSKVHRKLPRPVPTRAGADPVPCVRAHVPRVGIQRPRGGRQEVRSRIWPHARNVLSGEGKKQRSTQGRFHFNSRLGIISGPLSTM